MPPDFRHATSRGAMKPMTWKSSPSWVVSHTWPYCASSAARLPGSALISARRSRRICSVSAVTFLSSSACSQYGLQLDEWHQAESVNDVLHAELLRVGQGDALV